MRFNQFERMTMTGIQLRCMHEIGRCQSESPELSKGATKRKMRITGQGREAVA